MGKVTFTVVIAFVAISFISVCNSDVLEEQWDLVSKTHPKYEATKTFLDLMKTTSPENFDFYSIGQSVQGRELYVIRLGEISGERGLLVPKMKIVANMHGDETIGRALNLMLAVDMMRKLKANDLRVSRLLKETDIHLLISMNPDGFEAVQEGECTLPPAALGRTNANLKDLNRDFPDQFRDNETDFDKILLNRQPETQNVMKWIKSSNFILSANLHALVVVASYPFDSVPYEVQNAPGYNGSAIISYSPDHAFFFDLATKYADNHKTMREGCDPGEFKNGVVNGAEWYNVRGGMQDFNYVHSNCFEITLELSCCKNLPASALPGEWENNKESLYKFIEAVHSGAKGVVTSGGAPVQDALIMVEGINHPIKTNERGEYWRLLVPGKYNLWVVNGGAESPKAEVTVAVADPPTATIHNFEL